MNCLTAKDKEQLVRFLDSWLKTWAKNKKKGVYGNLWSAFRRMKDQGIENNKEFKQLGGFGLYLLNVILYSFQEYGDENMREEGEPRLVECVIALHLLTKYLGSELEILKIQQNYKSPPHRKRNAEFEKHLFSLLPKGFSDHFKKKIDSNESGYWQTTSEMRAIVLFHKLGITPKEVETQTVKGKNVDFISEYNRERVYVEVKGLTPKDSQKEKRGGSFGPDEEKIERALRRSRNKFFENSYNIVVIADEETTKTSLFTNPLLKHNNTPLSCLSELDNEKISALIILGGLYEEESLKFMIWYNPNAQKVLPRELKAIFDQNETKKYRQKQI